MKGDFENTVQDFIRRTDLFADPASAGTEGSGLPMGNTILIALSGGADSVCLLRVMQSLGYDVEAAHCNFHLRGEESLRDENFVNELTEKLGVRLHTAHFDTQGYAETHKVSIEMAARELRYQFFNELCDKYGFNSVAVAHHSDDNAETIVLNIIRGTGIKGLTGMRPRNGRIIRPLLCVTRQEILQYLEKLGQDFVTDSTNLQTDFTRNKIRLQLLPLMQTINPAISSSLCRMAEHLRDVEALSDKALEDIQEKLLKRENDGIWSLDIEALKEQTAPQTVLFDLLYAIGFTPQQVADIWQHIDSQTGARFSSRTTDLLIDRGTLKIKRHQDNGDETASTLLSEDTTVLPDFTVSFSTEKFNDFGQISRNKDIATIDADKITSPLTIRLAQMGDRFHPYGMKGSKLLSDYFTDKKVSLFERQRTYVVCSGSDIVWVVGHTIDNRFAIDDSTKKIVVIEVSAIP